MNFYVGLDVSKGYADYQILDHLKSELGRGRIDDSVAGRRRLVEHIDRLLAARGVHRQDSTVVFGAESSGGVEKNWLRFFRSLLGEGYRVLVHQLNPLAVRRAMEHHLHRRKTDEQDAGAVAEYLYANHVGMREYSAEEAELRLAAQALHAEVVLGGTHRNHLQSLLVHAHPSLVQWCRGGIPDWVLHLVQRYPTSACLAHADPAEVAELPYITPAKAERLVSEAQQSVASSLNPTTRLLMASKAHSILAQDQVIKTLEVHLLSLFAEDATFRLVRSIPGIGPRSALWLRIVFGDFSTFRSAKAAVAYAGLDPRVEQSGDSVRNNRISNRGKGTLRAVLYMAARTASRLPGPLREFHERLRARGKTYNQASVAVMAKIVRLAYTCALAGACYSTDTHAAASTKAATHRLAQEPKRQPSLSLTAPVSRKEALKRKKAAAPSEVKPQKAESTAQLLASVPGD